MTPGERRIPMGIKALSAFFVFGAAMAGISWLALLLPGTALSDVWRMKPSAQEAFLDMGVGALMLLAAIALGCAASAYGLWRGAEWARRLAVIMLLANLLGDAWSALFRGDATTLIGLPIAGAMILYLLSARARAHFGSRAR